MAGILGLKNKASETYSGVAELTDAEKRSRIAESISGAWTTHSSPERLPGQLLLSTSSESSPWTSVGTFVDQTRTEAVGTHPASGAITSTTYTLYQRQLAYGNVSGETASASVLPLYVDADGNVVEATDSQIKDWSEDIINEMVTNGDNTTGAYVMQASAPTGSGTWTSRYTLSDTQVDGTTNTKTIWQKTAVTSNAASDSKLPVCYDESDDQIREMTDSEVGDLKYHFGDAIIDSNIGYYVLAESAPGTGTWTQQGETITDQLKTITNEVYAGTYTGTYTDFFTNTFAGFFTGTFTGTYVGYYSRNFAGTYAGSYRPFFGGFAGPYYTGFYTGYYTGTFVGYYTGSYSSTFTGFFTGSFEGFFSGNYTGYYTGATITVTGATQSSRKLFVRIA